MDRLPPELVLAVVAALLPALFSSSSSSNGRDDDWIAPPPPPLSELAELRRVSSVCRTWEGLMKGERGRDVVVDDRAKVEDAAKARTMTVLRRDCASGASSDATCACLARCMALRTLSVVGGARLDSAFLASSPSTLRALALHNLTLSTALPSVPTLTSLYLDTFTTSVSLTSCSLPSLRLLSLHAITLAPSQPAPLAAFPSLVALSSDLTSLRPLLSASSPPTLPSFPPHLLLTLSLVNLVQPSSLFPSAGPSTLSPFFPDPPTHLSSPSLPALLSPLSRRSSVSLRLVGGEWAKEPSAFAAGRVQAFLRELGEDGVASVYIPVGRGLHEVYRASFRGWGKQTGRRVELDREEEGERMPQSWLDTVRRA